MATSAGASPTATGAVAQSSASASEKRATPPTTQPAAPSKQRSCLTCRQRKVRCDKLSPCSNCRRADIACVFPSAERPPRWARRLRQGAGATGKAGLPPPASGDAPVGASDSAGGSDVNVVLDRIRQLEGLVRQLSGGATTSGLPMLDVPGLASEGSQPASEPAISGAYTPSLQINEQFGRLVLDDPKRGRYMSSGFWSRVQDELNELRAETQYMDEEDSDLSDDEYWRGPRGRELDRTPSDRNGFLFGHNVGPGSPNLDDFRPLPSQIPFLFQIYRENVGCLVQHIYVPTVNKIIKSIVSGDTGGLSPANEALMFSIYYAAIISMDEEDVLKNFATSKAELSMRYRRGFEYSLAKSDFLNEPDIVTLQAFINFLALVRRHDSPRFVWMMTGMAIRMAHALGLQRDGTHFNGLTPFQIELRRRVWWAVCALDVRSSEDQGVDLTIITGTFDTKMPLHVNDSDLDEDTPAFPPAREEMTDMTFACVNYEFASLTRRMMSPPPGEPTPSVEQQSHILDEIHDKIERMYLRHSDKIGKSFYWVGVTITRMVIAKMTLILYLPTLFFSSSADVSAEIRTKLFTAAIEVAEYNHALNSEQSTRCWRWLYQTYTQWHSIAYILVEITRRPWSPTVERAWVALHSRFLIPPQADMNTRSLKAWIPLRKLMQKARRHRNAELERLRADPQVARRLEAEDRDMKSAPISNPGSEDLFRERWRQLVSGSGLGGMGSTQSPAHSQHSHSHLSSGSGSSPGVSGGMPFGLMVPQGGGLPQNLGTSVGARSEFSGVSASGSDFGASGSFAPQQLYPQYPTSAPPQQAGSFSSPWLWADSDPTVDVFGDVNLGDVNLGDIDVDMDLNGEVNWQNWFETVRGLEGIQPTDFGNDPGF